MLSFFLPNFIPSGNETWQWNGGFNGKLIHKWCGFGPDLHQMEKLNPPVSGRMMTKCVASSAAPGTGIRNIIKDVRTC